MRAVDYKVKSAFDDIKRELKDVKRCWQLINGNQLEKVLAELREQKGLCKNHCKFNDECQRLNKKGA